MLRRRSRTEVFSAVFFEARRRGHGWIERDARVLAARRGGDAYAGQETARRAVSARRRGWFEYCGAFRRTKLLPDAAEHCDSAAQARRNRCGDRSGRIFWAAPEPRATRAAVPQESVGHRARGGFARPDALAFRRAGFY